MNPAESAIRAELQAIRENDARIASERLIKARIDDGLSPGGLQCHCPACNGRHSLDLTGLPYRDARSLFQLDHLANDGAEERSGRKGGNSDTWRIIRDAAKAAGWKVSDSTWAGWPAIRRRYGLVCTGCNSSRGLSSRAGQCAYARRS